MRAATDPGPAPGRVERAGPWAVLPLGVAALAVLAVLGWVARRGFDRTDEGYYVLWAAHPRDVTADVLGFGLAYHPVWLLTGGHLTAFRLAGVVLTVLACGWLAWTVLGTGPLLAGGRAWPPVLRAGTALALGCAGLLTLAQLPGSPSYNTLTLQGLAVTAAGLVRAATGDGRVARVGWVAAGVGGWLTMLGKPTSAALLAGVALLVLAVVPGRWRRGAWLGVVAALAAAALTLLVYRLGPVEFLERLTTGVEASRTLGGHEDLIRYDPLPYRPDVAAPVLLTAVVVAALLLLVRGRAGAARWWNVVALGAVLAAGSALAAAMTSVWWPAPGTRGVALQAVVALGEVVGAAILLVALVAVVRARWPRAAGAPRPEGRAAHVRLVAGLTGMLLVLPFVYAFGTNGNLWSAAGRAVVFWLVVLTARLSASPGSLRVAPALVALLVQLPLHVTGTAAPYRYPDLRTAVTPAPVGPTGTVLLTASDAAAAADARRLAAELGIDDRSRVIDLTGASPGSVYLLGARPVGQAWMIGGYPGSEATARLVLESARCAARGAYVLVDEEAPRRIPVSVLGAAGLDLARDHRPVGELRYARAAWAGVPADPDARAVLHAPVTTGPASPCDDG